MLHLHLCIQVAFTPFKMNKVIQPGHPASISSFYTSTYVEPLFGPVSGRQ